MRFDSPELAREYGKWCKSNTALSFKTWRANRQARQEFKRVFAPFCKTALYLAVVVAWSIAAVTLFGIADWWLAILLIAGLTALPLVLEV